MPLEGPDQDYYVGAKVRISVRFDEYAVDAVRKTIAPNTKDTKNLRGNPAPRSALKAIKDPEASPAVSRFIITDGLQSTPVGTAADQSRSADGFTFRIEGVIPLSADWERNGFRKADTATIQVRFIDLPFDPRVMRAVAVDLFVGTVTAEEWSDGVAGGRRGPTGAEPLNVVPDTYIDSSGQERSNLRFEGWADAYEMSWSKDGDQVVTLECRDSTHLLTLLDAPSGATVDKTKIITEAIAEYLAQFPALVGLMVEYRPSVPGTDPPKLGDVLAGTSFQPQLGPAPAKGGGASGGDNLNVWDYLTDIAGAIGHTIRIEGRTLILQRLRDALDGRVEKRADDPYQTRYLPSRTYPYRTMIYGRNVGDLKIRKEFTKKTPTNIEVRCYNPRRKKVLVARFPEDKDKASIIARPGADTNDKKWTVIPVAGIEDEKILKFIAEDTYNSIGRNEVQVEVSTDNLSSYGGGNSDPDLLDMIPGDPVEILVNHDEDFNTMTAIADRTAVYERNRELMLSLGYDDDTARGYARAYTDANFQRVFRTREVRGKWSVEDGVSLELGLANYIEARADAPAQDGPQPVTNSPIAKQDASRKDAALQVAKGISALSSETILDKTKQIAPGITSTGSMTIVKKTQ